MAINVQGHQRVGHVFRNRHTASNVTTDDVRTGSRQEPATHDEAHQTLWNQLCHHRQTQTRDHQFTDALQTVADDQPVHGDDTRVGSEFRAQRQHQEGTRAQHHTNRELGRHWQVVAHLVIDSGQNWATDDDPERVERLILFRFERDTQNGVLNVTNREEVQRGWHLAVQHEEDNRFQHQNESHDHLTTRRTGHREGFFTKDDNDTQCNHAQNHTCDALVVQQPGRYSHQNHHADNGQQQVTIVNRLEVWLGTVLFNPTLTECEVHNGNQHTDNAQRERGAPAVFSGQPRGCQHREE